MQRPLAFFEERSVSLPKDEEFVELTLYDVSASLLKEFARKWSSPTTVGWWRLSRT